MARSLEKGPFIDDHAMKKVITAKKTNDNKPIKTWPRRSTIILDMIGLTFSVHNGKVFIPIYTAENRIGYKFGELVPTRAFKGHKDSVQKKIDK